AGRDLTFQAQGLAVVRALGDGDVDGAAIGERDALLASVDRLLQVDLELGAHVRSPSGKAAAEAAFAPPPAEHLAEDLVDVDIVEALGAELAALESARAGAEAAALTEGAAGE